MKEKEGVFLRQMKEELECGEEPYEALNKLEIEKIGGRIIKVYAYNKTIVVLKDGCSDEFLMRLEEMTEDYTKWSINWVVQHDQDGKDEYERALRVIKVIEEEIYGHRDVEGLYYIPSQGFFILIYEDTKKLYTLLDEQDIKSLYGIGIMGVVKDAFSDYTM